MAAPFDWQNDREYADPVPDVLGAADDARTAGRERGLAEPDEAAEVGGIRDGLAVDRVLVAPPSGQTDQPLSGSASPPSFEWAANLARLTYGQEEET